MEELVYILVSVMMFITLTRMPAFAEDGTATGQKQQAAGSYSNYTVEFSYNDIEYVMKGDTSVALSEILQKVGLSGKVTAASVSDESLFSVSNELKYHAYRKTGKALCMDSYDWKQHYSVVLNKDDNSCDFCSYSIEEKNGRGDVLSCSVFPGIQAVYNDLFIPHCGKNVPRTDLLQRSLRW